MTRPSFGQTIHALTLADSEQGIEPFEDCVDVAEVLRHLEATHRGGSTKDLGEPYWGLCSTCGARWPCSQWVWGEQLSVLFLGRAADRTWAHAQGVIAQVQARDREKRRNRAVRPGRRGWIP